jgi:hypothetical protein
MLAAIGLVPKDYPYKQCEPGRLSGSIAFCVEDGRLFEGDTSSVPFGPRCEKGDRIGCGVHFDQRQEDSEGRWVPVFFTRNGLELGSVLVQLNQNNFHPALSLGFEDEKVSFVPDERWNDVTYMAVDGCDEEWGMLSDIRLCGEVSSCSSNNLR